MESMEKRLMDVIEKMKGVVDHLVKELNYLDLVSIWKKYKYERNPLFWLQIFSMWWAILKQ